MIKTVVFSLILILALFAGFRYSQQHFLTAKTHSNEEGASEQTENSDAKPGESPDSEPIIVLEGPLTEWMQKVQKSEAAAPRRVRNLYASDRLGDSPVGTTNIVLHKVFAMGSVAKFPFEIPPYAATPKLRGTYKSYAHRAGIVVNDESGDIEFLVMNDSQYQDSVHGLPSSALFSADAAHDQGVNFQLPATLNHSVKYYLVFRSAPGIRGNKVVKADFQVDF